MIRTNRKQLVSDLFFFLNLKAITEIYTLSLHDALPICQSLLSIPFWIWLVAFTLLIIVLQIFVSYKQYARLKNDEDRKSTRLNSSHEWISYAVFCLKKKKN